MPLHIKEKLTESRIKQWYNYWHGKVYVSFSGGKDSTVLLHQVRKLYPGVRAVFVDTGLEYPEIRDFVKTFENVTWLKPKIPFNKVLKELGYPVVSKKQSRYISDLQNAHEGNKATVKIRLEGINSKGVYCPSYKLSAKWYPLVNSGFKISDKCCEVMKKQPFNAFAKEMDLKPMTGVMAGESDMRAIGYQKRGCNAYDAKHPISHPLSFWLEEDVWSYIKKYSVEYSKIYDMGEKRTGCMFCLYGVHLEKEPNRFQRMYLTHPKQWSYCIYKLGLGKILDFMGVPYKPKEATWLSKMLGIQNKKPKTLDT